MLVGCPIKNDLESFKEMYNSLINSTNCEFTFIPVIGEGTNQETIDYLQNLPFKQGVSIMIPELTTKTPLEAYNYLFNLAKERQEDLFLTQTDVLFVRLYKRDWLKAMFEISNIEIIGAVTSINGTGFSGLDYIDGFEWLGGWCTYYPYRTIEKIGGYDENFPNGYGVDIDHSYRISLSGLKVLKINYWVDHHQMNSREHDADPNTEQMKKESSIYFKKKWGMS